MNARHIRLGVGVLTIALVWGCQHHSQQSGETPSPTKISEPKPPAATMPADSAQSAESSEGIANLLARKTAAFARSAESTANSDTSQAPPTNSRRPKFMQSESEVRTNQVEEKTENPKIETAPPVKPSDANQAAVLARSTKSNPLNDVPAIVPESSDFAAAAPAASSGDALEDRLSKRMRENPKDIAAQLDYQLYQLLNDQSSPQLASISTLPNEDRELVSAIVDGISNFRSTVRQDNNMLLSRKIKPILELADRARSQGELNIPTVALCTKVDTFGEYTPVASSRFPGGRESKTLVYSEIENFEPRMNDQRQWETRLMTSVSLFTETGMLVRSEKEAEIVDVCRNRRHDFFVHRLFTFPKSLSIGRYLLKVSIVDRNANRVAESTTPVEIVAE